MTDDKKGRLIWAIIEFLDLNAKLHEKSLDVANTFFSLAFLGEEELLSIAKICNVEVLDKVQ